MMSDTIHARSPSEYGRLVCGTNIENADQARCIDPNRFLGMTGAFVIFRCANCLQLLRQCAEESKPAQAAVHVVQVFTVGKETGALCCDGSMRLVGPRHVDDRMGVYPRDILVGFKLQDDKGTCGPGCPWAKAAVEEKKS